MARALIWIVGLAPILVVIVSPRLTFNQVADPSALGAAGSSQAIANVVSGAMALLIFTLVLFRRRRSPATGRTLWLGAMAYSGGYLTSAFLGAQPTLYRGLFLLPLLLTAAYLLNRMPWQAFVHTANQVLAVYVYGSLIAIFVAPTWAYQSGYRTFLPGLDIRLTGLTSAANILGPLAVAFFLLQSGRRTSIAWVHRIAAVVVLVLSQAKLAWAAFVVCLLINWIYSSGKGFNRNLRRAAVITAGIGVVGLITLTTITTSLGERAFNYSNGGQNLDTLNQRTDVWRVTLRTWHEDPIFGYGPALWGAQYRAQFGGQYWWVGEAHNQFVQSLGESGLVGLAGLLIYVLLLIIYGVRFADRTRGMSLALVMLLVLRMLTEATLRNYAIDASFFLHFLTFSLLMQASGSGTSEIPFRQSESAIGLPVRQRSLVSV